MIIRDWYHSFPTKMIVLLQQRCGKQMEKLTHSQIVKPVLRPVYTGDFCRSKKKIAAGCNFGATKIALSCCDKNRLCKRAFKRSPLGKCLSDHLIQVLKSSATCIVDDN